MRYTGIVLVALSLLMAGLYAVRLTVRRSSELEAVVMMFQLIENDLSYSLSPFPLMVTGLSESDCLRSLDFLPECARFCSDGVDFPAAWRCAVNESRLLFNRAEKDKLMQFGGMAGTTDAQGQLNLCRIYMTDFERSYQRAEAFRRRYSGLFAALGVLLAVLAAVMLW